MLSNKLYTLITNPLFVCTFPRSLVFLKEVPYSVMAEEVGVPPVAVTELPFRHVAVIMDGNRRWARKHNVDIIEGHRKGSEVFRESIKWCMQLGVKEYTVYAFSCENWKRSEKEVLEGSRIKRRLVT